jgi:hypothetical protein
MSEDGGHTDDDEGDAEDDAAELAELLALAEEGGDDTEALVRDAERLPWADRLTHAHWRVRVEAYAAVTAAAAAAGDVSAPPLSDFGAPSPRRAPSCAFLTHGRAQPRRAIKPPPMVTPTR